MKISFWKQSINLKKLIFLFIFLTVSIIVFSQSGTVRGFVYDKENGEPMIFTNVYLKETMVGMATDINGYFNITNIDAGNYTLIVSFIGYDTLSLAISVSRNEIITKKLYVTKSSIKLDEFVISAEKQEMKSEIRTSIIKITPKQLEKIPMVGTQPDLAQYLQIVPGVIFSGDQGGQLYIRGGSPIQNKVLLDGMIVYNPFHSIGLFSVFDSDIIKNTDIFTGGFGAEYGARISSVMDISTRDGNKKKIEGKFSTSTFGSKILLEGPLSKGSKDEGSNSSFIFSVKNSYLEQTSKVFYDYIDSKNGLPFNFLDLYGKASFSSNSGSKVNIFGFNFTDHVKYSSVFDMNWDAKGIGSNIILVPSGSSVLVKANVSYSSYAIDFDQFLDNVTTGEPEVRINSSMINGYNVGLSFFYFLNSIDFDYGVETSGFTTSYIFENSVGRVIGNNEEHNTTELAGYIKSKFKFNKFIFQPGFRLHYYASLSNISPEPRLGIKYLVNNNLRLKLGFGMYSQSMLSVVSDRDVVNLFYGYVSEVDNLQDEFDGKAVTSKLQKSVHGIIGFEYDINNYINLNVETYYKFDPQLINLNKNKIYNDTYANNDKSDYFKKDFIIEEGRAYGVDFLLKYDYKRLYLWFVYSIGYIERFDGVYSYNPHFDRRHNVNLAGSYTFGRDLNWEISARWNLGSGFPFVKTQGFYENVTFNDGINTNYPSTNGQLGIIYTDVSNQGRLPFYHRLDVTLKKEFYVTTNSKLELIFSVTNLYNRQNIFYFDRVKYERVDQLPILPSFGLNFTF